MSCGSGDWACELTRIADAMNGFDWNNFIATLLATLVGAGVAAGVSFWVAERDRPRPMWKIDAFIDSIFTMYEDHSVTVEVTNIGDGAAYHPRATVDGHNPGGRQRVEAAVVEPGGSFSTAVSVPGSGELGTDENSGDPLDTRNVDWPQGLAVKIEWHQPPRRKHTKRTRVRIPDPSTGKQ